MNTLKQISSLLILTVCFFWYFPSLNAQTAGDKLGALRVVNIEAKVRVEGMEMSRLEEKGKLEGLRIGTSGLFRHPGKSFYTHVDGVATFDLNVLLSSREGEQGKCEVYFATWTKDDRLLVRDTLVIYEGQRKLKEEILIDAKTFLDSIDYVDTVPPPVPPFLDCLELQENYKQLEKANNENQEENGTLLKEIVQANVNAKEMAQQADKLETKLNQKEDSILGLTAGLNLKTDSIKVLRTQLNSLVDRPAHSKCFCDHLDEDGKFIRFYVLLQDFLGREVEMNTNNTWAKWRENFGPESNHEKDLSVQIEGTSMGVGYYLDLDAPAGADLGRGSFELYYSPGGKDAPDAFFVGSFVITSDEHPCRERPIANQLFESTAPYPTLFQFGSQVINAPKYSISLPKASNHTYELVVIQAHNTNDPRERFDLAIYQNQNVLYEREGIRINRDEELYRGELEFSSQSDKLYFFFQTHTSESRALMIGVWDKKNQRMIKGRPINPNALSGTQMVVLKMEDWMQEAEGR